MSRVAAIVVATLMLAGCSPTQQGLWASGGMGDFEQLGPIVEQYGDGPPDATLQVQVDGQDKPFKVWVSKKGPWIMVQNGLSSEIAGAAFTRGLTYGLANSGRPDIKPYEEAAQTHLASLHGPGACRITRGNPITHIGYQWDYDCSAPAPAPSKRAPKTR